VLGEINVDYTVLINSSMKLIKVHRDQGDTWGDEEFMQVYE